ncbi:hypothetical protein M5689_024905 [Euphorbia peplus]|nr:hypothetical protein M5689_024905 [Euphorbia peplus]
MKVSRACLVMMIIGLLLVSSEAGRHKLRSSAISVSTKSSAIHGYNLNLQDESWDFNRLVPSGSNPGPPHFISKRQVPSGPNPAVSPELPISLISKRIVPSGPNPAVSPELPPSLISKRLIPSGANQHGSP